MWILSVPTTMRKIDKSIVAKGKPRPCQWDPMFIRALLYAWPVALPAKFFKDLDDRIVNTADVKEAINAFDRIVSSLLLIASFTLVICLLIDWVFNF